MIVMTVLIDAAVAFAFFLPVVLLVDFCNKPRREWVAARVSYPTPK